MNGSTCNTARKESDRVKKLMDSHELDCRSYVESLHDGNESLAEFYCGLMHGKEITLMTLGFVQESLFLSVRRDVAYEQCKFDIAQGEIASPSF